MAVQAIDGSLEKALQNAPNASSYSNPGGALVSPSGESPKPSISGARAGISFVIPKNKLSGALVPVVRNLAGKWEPSEVKKDEESKSLVPQRKTKWGGDLTQDPAVKRGRALALQTRAEQIAAQLESGQLDIDTNETTRSPSPPPIYDSNGQRTNTREGRRREQLELERREAIGDCVQLNPFYKPPSGYKPVYKEAKLYIPVKDYPGYNFIGLILGPRGNTQKRMEAETGSRIAIRGKGAVKEGKKSNAARLQGWKRDSKEAEGAFEDLHVHITADSVEKVDAAVALVEPLLTPVDEDRNTHKRKQLRELAEMNGTMRDFSKACGVCGEMGHREWHCPRDKLITFQAKVDCQICRDGGHPSVDCPRKQNGQGKVLDKEYLSFLEELGDGLAGPIPVTTSGLSMKLGSEDSSQSTNNQPNPKTITTPLHEVERVSHPDTSLDPNQLVDVVSRSHTTIIALNQTEHIPTAWPPGHPFINSCERRTSVQQGGYAQIEIERPFSGMLQRNQSHFGLNVNSDNFPHPGFSHGYLPPTYQGCPSAVMPLNREGLPAPQNFHAVSDWVPANRSHFYGGCEAGPGSLTYPMPPPNGGHLGPGQMQTFNTATPESSRLQPIPWNQTRSSQPIGTMNATMIWEDNQVPRPQTAWTRGLPTQLPPSAGQMAREQGWKQEPSAMLPHSLGLSAGPPWEVTQIPWEASSPCLSTGFNQPWQSSQRRPMQYNPSHPYPPIPGSGTFVWRGGPARQSVRMPLPIQSDSMPPPPPPLPNLPSQQHPFPPSHSQPIPGSNKKLNDHVLCRVDQSRSSFTPQPLPPDTLGLQLAGDLCTPDRHPSPRESSNTEKDESQSQVEAAFTSSSGVAHDSPSSLDKQSQEVQLDGSPKTRFAAPNTRVTGSPVEVDAEYERLMVSVGVT